jgi:hypothetical protein
MLIIRGVALLFIERKICLGNQLYMRCIFCVIRCNTEVLLLYGAYQTGVCYYIVPLDQVHA